MSDDLLSLFRQTGALLDGHFVLRSGLHSRQFFQCALALQQMPVVERLGGVLADRVRHLNVATVVAPTAALSGALPNPEFVNRN